MKKLDDPAARHIEERLQTILAAILDPRQARGARQRAHAADLAKPAAEALKDRIDSLRAIRDQARADEARAQSLPDQARDTAATPQMPTRLAAAARAPARPAPRVAVAEGKVRITGSKLRILRTLALQ